MNVNTLALPHQFRLPETSGPRWRHLLVPNRTLVVGVRAIPPYIYDCSATEHLDRKKCPHPGIDYEIFDNIINVLNLTVRYYPVPYETNWGTNNTNGLLGDIGNGVMDTMNVWYRITEERLLAFDFTTNIPYAENRIGFIVSKAGKGIDLDAGQLLYKVFPPTLWLVFVSVIVLLSMVNFGAKNLAKWKKGGMMKSVRDLDYKGFWESLVLLLDQSYNDVSTGTVAGNLSKVLLGFSILFLTTLYEGGLVGSLMRTQGSKPFRSMTELAELVSEGKFRLAHDGGISTGFFWGFIRESNFSAYRALNRSMQSKSAVVHGKTVDELLDKIEADPTLVYPGQDRLSAELGLMKGRCKLEFIDDDDSTTASFSGFIFRPNDSFMPAISEVLSGLSSMAQLTERQYIHREREVTKKLCAAEAIRKGDPLAMRHFYGVIMVCCLLFGAAVVSLVTELVLSIFKSKILAQYNQRKHIIRDKVIAIGMFLRARNVRHE